MAEFAICRAPPEESASLYPGLRIRDNRVNGSVTAGQSRLPLWCFVGVLAVEGWPLVQTEWDPEKYGWGKEEMAEFLHCLLEQRGEFGRLLLILADVERREVRRLDCTGGDDDRRWWEMPGQRRRMVKQLRRCLKALGEEP